MKHLRLNPPPPRALAFPFCELNSSLIVLPSISVLLQEFIASLASSAVAKSTNAYLCGEEDSSQPGSKQGIPGSKSLAMPAWGSKDMHNVPLRPALVVLWHLDGSSFLKHFLQSLFCGSI